MKYAFLFVAVISSTGTPGGFADQNVEMKRAPLFNGARH
jgi:hypothetical protein